MRIGVLSEGTIDFELLFALLARIAREGANVRWPLRPSDVIEQLRFRTGGYGQVVKAVRRLVNSINREPFSNYSLFIVVLDYKAAQARKAIRKQIRGNSRFVLGTAIREIEAWWLADRRNTLEWLGLDDTPKPLRYWSQRYNPERDDAPKRTLNELTRESTAVNEHYGDGSLALAMEFAAFWRDRAELAQIRNHCPRGFDPFFRDSVNGLRRESRRHAR